MTLPKDSAQSAELWDIDQVTQYLNSNTIAATRYVLAQWGVEAAAYRRPGGTGQPRAFYDANQVREAAESGARGRSTPSVESLRVCASPDCTRPAQPSREWCAGHYGRVYQHGDLKLGVPFKVHRGLSVPTECVTAGCTEQALGGTLYCADHDVSPVRTTTCAVQGCDRTVFSTGLCSRCFRSWRDRGHNRSRYRTREGRCEGRCAVCRWDHARETREHRLAALEQGPLNAQARREIVARVWDGEPLEKVAAAADLSVQQLWSTGVAWPEFVYAVDAGLMARRDPDISHGTAYAYRVHGCRCPQCRAAKMQNR